MLEVTNRFKERMKAYGKQINVLLEFGGTVLNKDNVVSMEQDINGELFTSIMRLVNLEVEKYSAVDFDSLLTVKDVHDRIVEEVDNTRTKYLTARQDETKTVNEVDNMTVNEIDTQRVKTLLSREKQDNITSASEIKIKLGVKYEDEENYEYIDFGTFEVYEIEDCVDTQSYKLTLYDYLIETHVKYDDDPLTLNFASGNITVGILLQAICNKFGFNLLTPTFVNSNNIVSEDKYLGLDFTYRDILDEISAVAGGFIKIFNKDLSVAYPTETGEIIDEDDLETLDLKDSLVGPFNTVILGRSPQEDNIYYPTGISKDNRIAIRIDNNQIMDRNREDYIVNLYNKLNGLYYYAFEFQSFGFGYYEFGDIVTLRDLDGKQYKTIFLNIIQTINQGIKEKAYSEKTDFSEKTDYDCATSIEKRVINTEIICNKQENKIQLLIEQQGNTTTKINSLEMDLDSTKSRIQNFEDTTNQRMSSIEQTTDQIVIDVSNVKYNINNNIYTKTQTNSLIQSMADQITISVSNTYATKSELNGYVTTSEMTAAINVSATSIRSEVNEKVNTTDFGTLIEQNYSHVRIAWNNYSEYVQFEYSSLNIYDSNDKRLLQLNRYGMYIYVAGTKIGSMAMANWEGNTSIRGLAYNLDMEGSYMCWARKKTSSASSYTIALMYCRANSPNTSEGLYLGTNMYADGNSIYFDSNKYVRALGYSNGAGIKIDSNYFFIVNSSNSNIVRFSSSGGIEIYNGSKIECYREIDMHWYSIRNVNINDCKPIVNQQGYGSINYENFIYYTNGSASNYGYIEIGTSSYGAVGVNVWQSDGRLKTRIRETEVEALDVVNQIPHRAFEWKTGGHEEIGYIAQEMEEIKESFVMKIPQKDENGTVIDEVYQINETKLIPYLSKAIQELSTENNQLKSIIERQQTMIDYLYSHLNINYEEDP